MLRKTSYGWTYRCREAMSQFFWRLRRRPEITREINGTVTDWPKHSDVQAALKEMKS